jgi:nucleotide-binding universal stress UspA family protein
MGATVSIPRADDIVAAHVSTLGINPQPHVGAHRWTRDQPTIRSRRDKSRGAAVFKNILVGVDGRQGGRDAIALATRLAAPGARVTLAHVYPIRQASVADRNGDPHKMLRDERAGAGVEARILAVPGSSVGDALHQLAARRHYDLLVVGSCHRGAIGRRLAGDHTTQSVKDARCAVAIATRGYAAALA